MPREEILKLIEEIKPYDAQEVEHILDAINWIESGAEIFRIQKPDVPPKHLVSYFVLVDSKKKILLLDHVKSGLWLPSGGHVEKDEYPNAAVEREIKEELNMSAEFLSKTPFFLTQAVTVGKKVKEHTDVSLWYVLKGDSEKEIVFDPEEYYRYEWMSFAEVLTMNIEKLDIHMHRFMKKLIDSNLVISN